MTKTFYVKLIFLFILIPIPGKGQITQTITQLGGIGDGIFLNTKIIQSAIDELSKKGGGKLVFTKGKFLTGSVILKSNVELHLQKGAILLGSTNPYDYLKLKSSNNIQSERTDNSELALILAYKANQITITGKGCIDGQGRALALNIDSLHHAGILIDPLYNTKRLRPNETARPKLFLMTNCNQIKICNLNLRNSACWGLTFDSCSNLLLDNLSIVNRAYWNNDGIDITDCQQVKITHCFINSADDGICLKSYNSHSFNDSISITDCKIISSSNAIKMGTASWGGFKNININHIRIRDTYRSAIAIESVDGGLIEHIKVSNISAKNTGNAIFIRLGNRNGKNPGTVKDIIIKNIKVKVPFGRPDINYELSGPEVNFFHNPFPASITGIPGHNVENISLENIKISYPGRASKGMAYIPLSRLSQVPEAIKDYPEFTMFGELPSWGFYLRHINGIVMKSIKLILRKNDYRPALILDDVKDLNLYKLKLPKKQGKKQVIIENCVNVNIYGDKHL